MSEVKAGPFTTTLLDVPAPEIGGGHYKRGADRHYRVLDKPGCKEFPEILSVILAAPNWNPAADAHLWSWTTDNYLIANLWLIEKLGFEYKRTFVWVKVGQDVADAHEGPSESDLRAGIGQYARGCHELLLFATRGRGFTAKTERKDIKSVILAPHERENGKIVHSRKPIKSYELIEARSRGPFAEIFARRGRPGWVSFGDEYKE